MTLTAALSHPMGEGESSAVGWDVVGRNCGFGPIERKRDNSCSLSRLTGEGQGEGILDLRFEMEDHGNDFGHCGTR